MTTILLAAQAAQQGGSMSGMLIMMVAIFAIMYFLMIRPQQVLRFSLAVASMAQFAA